MDEIVKQAMAKWPNVPHCFGWLALDARGVWRMRDDRAQSLGLPGDRIANAALLGFINRNYMHDERGRWYFQNGPQRVYVEIEATPWIWRLADDFSVSAHTGQPVTPSACLLDGEGRLYLVADIGVGLVHTLDMGLAADAIEQGRWAPESVRAEDLPARFGFVRSPAAGRPPGAPAAPG